MAQWATTCDRTAEGRGPRSRLVLAAKRSQRLLGYGFTESGAHDGLNAGNPGPPRLLHQAGKEERDGRKHQEKHE